MAVPSAINAQTVALQTAYQAAQPLATASKAQIYGLQQGSVALVQAVDIAILADTPSIDGFAQPVNVQALPGAVTGLLSTMQEQASLTELRGYVGRVASNLAQQVY
jgi:hypothetical protein